MAKGLAHATVAWQRISLLWLLAITTGGMGAVESTTESFASMASVIRGKGTGDARMSFIALPKISPIYYAGKITALNATTLTDANATWLQNQFNAASGTFFLEFDSGVLLDIALTDASAKSLSIPDTFPPSISVGDTYRIRRHQTLADFFGSNNEAGLQEGSNSAEADNVLLHIPETQQILTFFFSNYTGFRGWYRDDYTPAGNTVIYPEQGLIVRRKGDADVIIYSSGTKREIPMRVPVYAGFNLMGTLQVKKAIKLNELNLYTGNPTTGFAASSNPSDADNLVVIKPDAGTQTFFYSDYPGFEGWFDVSYSPSDAFTIPPGSAFFLNRKAPRPLFHWIIPSD